MKTSFQTDSDRDCIDSMAMHAAFDLCTALLFALCYQLLARLASLNVSAASDAPVASAKALVIRQGPCLKIIVCFSGECPQLLFDIDVV